MIIVTVPNDKPQSEIGQAFAQDVAVSTIPEQPLDDFCLCSLGLTVCEYTEYAFYDDAVGASKYNKDYTSLYVNKVDPTDVIVFTLINKQDDTETVLDANNAADYGIYSDDNNHAGILVDFTTLKASNPSLVNVSFRIDQTVFGTPLTRTTHKFQILKFNAELADGTVRIETISNGRIESGADYDSLNWKKSLRIRGHFGKMQPKKINDNYFDEQRIVRQIQDKVERSYSLSTELLPQAILDMIALNDMLANEIIVSDYNLLNANYKGVQVTHDSTDASYYEGNQNGSYEMEFLDRKQNIIKRNV